MIPLYKYIYFLNPLQFIIPFSNSYTVAHRLDILIETHISDLGVNIVFFSDIKSWKGPSTGRWGKQTENDILEFFTLDKNGFWY